MDIIKILKTTDGVNITTKQGNYFMSYNTWHEVIRDERRRKLNIINYNLKLQNLK